METSATGGVANSKAAMHASGQLYSIYSQYLHAVASGLLSIKRTRNLWNCATDDKDHRSEAIKQNELADISMVDALYYMHEVNGQAYAMTEGQYVPQRIARWCARAVCSKGPKATL